MHIDNEIQRIQAQLHPFMLGNTEPSENEVEYAAAENRIIRARL